MGRNGLVCQALYRTEIYKNIGANIFEKRLTKVWHGG